jgi:acyl-CoA thioester hydrolase
MSSEPLAATPAPEPYVRTIWARWGDMDFNGHMRNTAYLDASGDLRVHYFADHGFTAREFERLQVGPVILRDTLEYYRELHLLEEVEVRLQLLGLSEDGSHFRMRNDFRRPDGQDVQKSQGGQKIARVESTGGWLDLAARKLTAPPAQLYAVLHGMPRAAEFAPLDSLLRR